MQMKKKQQSEVSRLRSTQIQFKKQRQRAKDGGNMTLYMYLGPASLTHTANHCSHTNSLLSILNLAFKGQHQNLTLEAQACHGDNWEQPLKHSVIYIWHFKRTPRACKDTFLSDLLCVYFSWTQSHSFITLLLPPSTTRCVLTGCPHASLLGAAGVLDVTLHQTPLHPLCYVCVPVCVSERELNGTNVHACENCVCPSGNQNAKCYVCLMCVCVCTQAWFI